VTITLAELKLVLNCFLNLGNFIVKHASCPYNVKGMFLLLALKLNEIKTSLLPYYFVVLLPSSFSHCIAAVGMQIRPSVRRSQMSGMFPFTETKASLRT